ncbi:methyltransferase domain-containing protein [Obba rivulosa]|uniref:Alpha N-terminal protein methyltransferase 1 n=1 Tax=Obba rivulosa TaxID=1052685 RepID=A0A8E2DSN3_9APHY|nr:methyltransferase domain-containing protein [Obba rivulosa]
MASAINSDNVPDPDVELGMQYWADQPANYDGVLGGFGSGSLPRVDALGSRQFLQYLMPELCTVPSAIRPLGTPAEPQRRTRALDVGAGVGRVTGDVLLHLVSDVVLVEPVEPLVKEALARGTASASLGATTRDREYVLWKGIADKTKSVTFIQDTLQGFDPCHPLARTKRLGRVGFEPSVNDIGSGFDVIWCQWCLGCLSDPDLVTFFKRCRLALRDPRRSVIVVKENLCSEVDGEPRAVFDETDSSLTRSDLVWKKAFSEAGLHLIHEQVQHGFPEGLYPVKMYALR